jgi:hypothetical protein
LSLSFCRDTESGDVRIADPDFGQVSRCSATLTPDVLAPAAAVRSAAVRAIDESGHVMLSGERKQCNAVFRIGRG